MNDMAGQLGILVRPVGPEVGPATLGAREGALGDQPGEQVRRLPEALEPGRVADQARIVPERTADLGRDCLERRSLRWIIEPSRKTGLVERRQAQGAAVVVVSPPPLAGGAEDAALALYRLEAERVARQTGAAFISGPGALAGVSGSHADGVHLSPAGYAALAAAVASALRREP